MPNIAPDRVSVYSVPLVCPAAPEIGCGSRSKPVLLALERRPEVAQAWLKSSRKPDSRRVGERLLASGA
jgi:hypothetical protein